MKTKAHTPSAPAAPRKPFPIKALTWALLLVMLLTASILLLQMPHTLTRVESQSYFVWTDDFLQSLLSKSPFHAVLIGTYLTQFYRWVPAALAIILLVTLLTFLSATIPLRRLHLHQWYPLALLPAAAQLLYAPYDPTLQVLILSHCLAAAALVTVITLPALKQKHLLQALIVLLTLATPLYLKALWSRYIAYIPQEDKQYHLSLLPTDAERWQEEVYHWEDLAEASQWSELLTATQHSTLPVEHIRTHYALLAEKALGTLPQHLFDYPVTPQTTFLYQHEFTPLACNFNYLFYRELHVYDEAFHQAFEEGNSTPHGITFRTLRRLTETALHQGDTLLAKKYLAQLSHSTLHSTWIKEKTTTQQTKQKTPTTPEKRTHIFCGGLTFDQEMSRLSNYPADQYPGALDYLLCSLLLQKNMNLFTRIMMVSTQYKDKPLPRAYAEALCVSATQVPEVLQQFQIPPTTQDDFQTFVRLHNQQDLQALQPYRHTLWYYLQYVE